MLIDLTEDDFAVELVAAATAGQRALPEDCHHKAVFEAGLSPFPDIAGPANRTHAPFSDYRAKFFFDFGPRSEFLH